MSRVHRLRLVSSLLPLMLLWVGPAAADEELETKWSTTVTGELKVMSGEEARDDVTGFFDRYEFVPNKSSSFPVELGIPDASFDLLGSGETPLLQFRLASPTSNLGVSGSQIDEPFFNQRADLFGRFDGVHFDIDYRRLRTEELRLFPNASTTLGPSFTDLTGPSDHFNHDRTGFGGEVRLRPLDLLGRQDDRLEGMIPEISLRGGYEGRDGNRQLRFLLEPTNSWLSLSQPADQSVAKVGAGVFVAPGGLFTMALDFDHKRFREDEPATLQSNLGAPFPSNSRTIGFIPDTNRSTGTIRLNSRIGNRAVLEGGFQISSLEQVGDLTPAQQASGLRDNSLLFYSANLGADVAIVDRLSANAFFKFDRRENDIERGTSLFNSGNQVAPFFQDWSRMALGVEAVYRPRMQSLVALGVRYEAVDRTLDFAPPIPGNQYIPAANSMVSDSTQMYTVYGRTNLRPVKGLGVRAEVGYRGAPDTGYIVDLDKYVYGKLRASYVLPIEHTVVVSAFGQGGSGENRNFSVTGPTSTATQHFDRYNYLWGVTVTTPVRKDTTIYASFFDSQDAQDSEFVTSNIQRYFAGTNFTPAGVIEYRNDQMSLTVGSHLQLLERTDGGIAYSFTRAEAIYEPGVYSSQIGQIQSSSIIDSDIHGFDFELGHWVKDGLRVLVGYRLELHGDNAPVPTGVGSVVTPFDLSMTQHAVRVGVTLTSDLLKKKD